MQDPSSRVDRPSGRAGRTIVWTDYMRFRSRLRGFELAEVERVVVSPTVIYFDTESRRLVAVGKIGEDMVMVPFDSTPESITPVTVHVTTRQQVRFRLMSGRFKHVQK